MCRAFAGLTLTVALVGAGATAEAHDRHGYLYAPYPPAPRHAPPPPRVYHSPPYYVVPPPAYVVPRPVPYGHYGHYRPHRHHLHRHDLHRPRSGVFFSFRF
jgi:hypothetical protein